jgi:2-methylcitrate dehydratase PrpD
MPEPSVEWLSPETIRKPEILKFMNRVKVGANVTARLGGYVKLIAKGRIYEKKVDIPKGSLVDGFRLSEKELEAKFVRNVAGILTEEKITKIVKTIYGLEELANIKKLTSLLII